MSTGEMIWIDSLLGTGPAEVPAEFADRFAVRVVGDVETAKSIAAETGLLAVVFEFDYPARRGLESFARFKHENPSIPTIMVTLQHSEVLTKWAFRVGALDVLVRPLATAEMSYCIRKLVKIKAARELDLSRYQLLRRLRKHGMR